MFGQAQYAQIPMAVVGIVMKFFQIIMSVSIGLAAGCIPVVGYNMGAERRDRAQREQQRQEFSFHGGYRYERLRGIAARSGDSAYSHFFQRKNR